MEMHTMVILIFVLLRVVSRVSPNTDRVFKGFSASDMSWVDNDGQFLQSANGKYIALFFNTDDQKTSDRNTYYLCVMLSAPPSNPIIWTANRDVPIGRWDKLVFDNSGNLLLFGPRGLPIWQTGTNGTDAQALQLQDSGNLVLLDSKNSTVWESFDHPTDTLLVGQKLKTGMQLVSSISDKNYSPGSYSLTIGNSLELLVDLGGERVAYWRMSSDPRLVDQSTNSNSKPAYAGIEPGKLSLYGSDSSQITIFFPTQQSLNGTGVLVLQPGGNLLSRVLTLVGFIDEPVFEDKCQLPSICGPFGICSSSGQCSCPDNLSPVNSDDVTRGCKSGALSTCNNEQDVEFKDLESDLSYFANQFVSSLPSGSLQECKEMCHRNCSCSTGFFNTQRKTCYLSVTQKLGSFQNRNSGFQTFIKVARKSRNGSQNVLIYVIVGCSVGLIVLAIGTFIFWYRRRLKAASGDQDEEDGFLEAIPGLPTRFTYRELQAATNGFSKKLGGGGFGSVYEGILPDKTKVAVKQLESIGQGKKEFRAEVATIGSIHHVNLVRLRGFCSEGNHRLLVYEHLARGSLDKSLFPGSNPNMNEDGPPPLLDWDMRYNIALGTARGLAYLHEDCRERIIHCDIKPENILLDENVTAKVSDFGLAKLMNREQSHVFTTLRGTRGYLAPEWLLNTAISEKSDVYSFGMVLLEIVSGRKNFDPTETSDKWYIPAYAFKQAEVGSLLELLDSKLKGQANEEQVVKAVKIALWCIQEEMHIRPSTGKVVQMLEGNIPVPDPPLSSQLAVRLHARMVDAVSERDRYSIYSDYNSDNLLSASYLSGPR